MSSGKNKQRSGRTEALILTWLAQRNGEGLKPLFEDINVQLRTEGVAENTYNSFYSIVRKLVKLEKIVQGPDQRYYVTEEEVLPVVWEEKILLEPKVQSVNQQLQDLLIQFQTPVSLKEIAQLVEAFHELTFKPSDLALFLKDNPEKQQLLIDFMTFCESMKEISEKEKVAL